MHPFSPRRRTSGFSLKSIVRLIIAALWSIYLTAYSHVAHSAAAEPKNADIRVLIDVSGSMKQNDPRNLRRPALDLLLQLFTEQSKAGVWTFGQYVNMLVPHDQVNAAWRNRAEPKSRLVNSVALRTNIGLALEKANYDHDKNAFPASRQFQRSIILLTDGVVDIDKSPSINERERQRILDDVLPSLQEAGVVVHTIALSTNADVDLLEQLSEQTDGLFAVAEDASDLNRIFLQAFDQAAPADRVPLEDNRFLIDSSVEEFTVLVFRKADSAATELVSPSGVVYRSGSSAADIRWFDSAGYDLITVERPDEGQWRINAEMDPENRVTVVSDLSVAFADFPSNVYLGQRPEISLQVMENGEPLARTEFLELLSVDASLSRDRTKFWSENLPMLEGQPGRYARSLDMLSNLGRYTVNVHVDGKTFQREKRVSLTVREPFRIEVAGRDKDGAFDITVIAADKSMRSESVELSADITQPDRSTRVETLAYQGDGVWTLSVEELVSGKYGIALRADGSNATGQTLGYALGSREILLEVPGAPAPVLQDVEPTPQPEELKVQPKETEEVTPAVAVESDTSELVGEGEDGISWLVYLGLGVANLLMLAGLFFAYRKVVGADKPAASEVADSDGAEQDLPAETAAAEAVDNSAMPEQDEPKPNDEDGGELEDESAALAGQSVLDESIDSLLEADDANDDAEADIEIDLESMLEDTADNNDDSPAETAADTPVDEALEEQALVEELLAEAAAVEAVEAESEGGDTNGDDQDDITLELDGAFDLSSDLSDDNAGAAKSEAAPADDATANSSPNSSALLTAVANACFQPGDM